MKFKMALVALAISAVSAASVSFAEDSFDVVNFTGVSLLTGQLFQSAVGPDGPEVHIPRVYGGMIKFIVNTKYSAGLKNIVVALNTGFRTSQTVSPESTDAAVGFATGRLPSYPAFSLTAQITGKDTAGKIRGSGKLNVYFD